jgi:ABC-type branched-subunit amino acid transport system substrate-binding protein
VLPAKPIVLPAVLPVQPKPVPPTLPIATIVRTFGRIIAGRTTIRVGCIAPFTGVKASQGESMFQALRLAFQEQAAKELGANTNVVLTCVDAKCSDISAYNAMDYLARTGAGG